MSRHLVGTVHVQDEHGNDHAFGPDDNVPAWAAEKITNPVAWSEPAADREPEPDAADKPPAGNASEEKWREHALRRGIPAEDLDGLGRDQIKEKVTALPPAEPAQ